jgi:hypothetical protein
MLKFKEKLIGYFRFFYKLIFKLRIYPIWSRIFQLIYHTKYRRVKLDSNLGLEKILEKISLLTWVPDKEKALFDAFGSPHWVQFCINKLESGKPQPKGYLDCDEFAIWVANTIKKEYNPKILNVSWYDVKLHGHNLVLLEKNNKYRHISNWGLSREFETFNKLLLSIIKKEKNLIGYCVMTKKLKIEKIF